MQGFVIKLIPQKHLYRSQDKRYLTLNYMNVTKWVIFNGEVTKVTHFFLSIFYYDCATVARELWRYILHIVGVQEVGGKRGTL